MIGPRPHLVSEYCQYNRQVMPRLYCKPGLTGLWQVSGRADTTFEEQLNLDKQYIVEQSVWTDVKILALTVPAVLAAKGAYKLINVFFIRCVLPLLRPSPRGFFLPALS